MVINPLLTVIISDFNGKLGLWYNNDISTYEDSKTKDINSQFGLQKIILHFDFSSQLNLDMEFGVHSYHHANYHHHITFWKFNLRIYYFSSYEQEAWHYQKAYADQIRQAINELPWDNPFANINVNEQVQLFTQTIQNVISNYGPHKTVTCDGRNPPWINKNIKKLMLYKNCAFRAYSREGKTLIFLINFNPFKHS